MCGIVGYIGTGFCENVLLENLQKLEYRGYDSSGISVKKKCDIVVVKDTVKVSKLIIETETKNTCGIGHTRWATNGKVSRENAHPHMSNNGEWSIVHNGIIDNYLELKNIIEKNANFTFRSTCDSEVIAQLLEYKKVSNVKDFGECISMLKGSFAICAINNFENKIYFAKNKSPLYIGFGEKEYLVASDVVCFNSKYTKFIQLDDYEFGVVYDNNIIVYDKNNDIVDLKYINNIKRKEFVGKCGYLTFMEKEINEIGEVLKNIVDKYSKSNYFDNIIKYRNYTKKICIFACGTSYHSGLMGARYLREKLGIEVVVCVASEYEENITKIDKNTMCIFISQSGETADTIRVIERVLGKSLCNVLITNSIYSTMARMCDIVLPIFAGPEIAVASTKAYNAQVLVLYLFSTSFNSYDEKFYEKFSKSLKEFDIKSMYKMYEIIQENFDSFEDMFLLGKHSDYITMLEACLKIREICYEKAIAIPSGEIKHGTLALISKKSLCIVLVTRFKNFEKNITAINEVRSRGGKVLLVTQLDIDKENIQVDYIFKLPKIESEFIDLISIIPFQIFSMKLSLKKNINPDMPRNLAKSVTVD